jgi:hypothetical protein
VGPRTGARATAQGPAGAVQTVLAKGVIAVSGMDTTMPSSSSSTAKSEAVPGGVTPIDPGVSVALQRPAPKSPLALAGAPVRS